jgi:FkbM family methyltransferase
MSGGTVTRSAAKAMRDFVSIVDGFENWPTYFAHYLGVAAARDMTIRLRKHDVVVKSVGRHWEFHSLYRLMFTEDEYGLRRSALARGSTIIDVGAHIGWFTLSAAAFVPEATIFAYEPSPENFRLLTDNIALNDLSNVHAFEMAVYSRAGDAEFATVDRFGGGSTGGTLLAREMLEHDALPPVQRVRTTTLDEIFAANAIGSCALLKLDCEGAEHELLASTSDRTMARIARISVEAHDFGPYTMGTLESLLVSKGYRVTAGGVWGNVLHAVR